MKSLTILMKTATPTPQYTQSLLPDSSFPFLPQNIYHWITSCYGLNCVCPTSQIHVEALILTVIVLGDREVLKLNIAIRVRPQSSMTGVLITTETRGMCSHRGKTP